MPDVQDSSTLVDVVVVVDDPSSLLRLGRRICSKALRTILLHDVTVTTLLFAVIMSLYICLYRYVLGSVVASLLILLIAYHGLGCLYVCNNSSGWQKKTISTAYLVFVQFVFLVSSIRLPDPVPPNPSSWLLARLDAVFISGTNIVAISSYYSWKLRFVIINSGLNQTVRTVLHGAAVAILLSVVVVTYVLARLAYDVNYAYPDAAVWVWLLVELVAYNAVACLYICNSSGRKEKIISAGFLVLVLLVFLLWSLLLPNGNDVHGTHPRPRLYLIVWANIVALSSYCVWKLSSCCRRRCLRIDGPPPPAAAAAMAPPPPRQPAHQAQEEEAVLRLHAQTTPFRFRIQEVLLREFSSDEIQAMTQDFGTMIGRGGSAQVFRGNLALDDGNGGTAAVAVKRINIHIHGEEDFRRELSIIANVHHRSLVRLLGYCLQRGGGGLYLVYPFFHNGSLDRWIFDSGNDEQRRLLTWPKRFCIAVDVARALAYLHNECHRRILHLDVKLGNILLDGDLRAHVSDFGISLSITRGLTSVINTRGRGTFGYMAPEMLYNVVSDKSDVFSYGMTLLELVGGRRNMYPTLDTPDITREYFPYIVRDMVARGEVMGAVDAAMAASVDDDEEAVKAVLKVALCCIQNQREMRPTMQTVVDMLEGRVAVELPPEMSRHHLL